MIGRLRGTLVAFTGRDAVVDVAGVGYRVAVAPGRALPPVGDDVVLHTHLHVREDALALYGFPTVAERDLFELLLACNGVGPKVALACLSVLSPDRVAEAVRTADVDTLSLVPGVGRRSAEKLIFELAPRLGAAAANAGAGPSGDVREALLGLGYAEREVSRVLGGLPSGDDTGALLREALRLLGSGV